MTPNYAEYGIMYLYGCVCVVSMNGATQSILMLAIVYGYFCTVPCDGQDSCHVLVCVT